MIKFRKPTVEQFFQTYVITDFTVSEDEQRLIFSSNLNGKMNVWAMDIPDQFPYLFAQRNESCNFLKFDPKNRYILAGFDQDGDENYHIYAIPFEGGLPQPVITGEAEDKFYFSQLSEDGERIYYMTSEDNPSFMNTRIRNLHTGEDQTINVGEQAPTSLACVSPNEKAFVYLQVYANTYVIGYLQIEDEQYLLTPDHEKVHITLSPVFIDDETVYFITDFEANDAYLAKYNIRKDEFQVVLKIADESMTDLKWNKHTGKLYIVTEKGVTDYLYTFDPESEELKKVTTPIDVIYKIEIAKSGTIYLLGLSATIPTNIFQLAGDEWKQLTKNNVLGVSEEQMVEPEIVSYPSFDGIEIEALLFRAKPEHDNGYTIFWPHGGPQAAERKTYRSMFQCFLNRGYTIFAPNFRGSTGYGSEFVKLVEQDWGHGPRLDCIYGVEWLYEQGITDSDRLFLVGGSYGGYMALLLHGRHAEYFKAVVDIFGPSDLFTFIKSVPPHWKPIMERWLGDPDRDRERFIRDSPVTYLDGMTKPMLVIQGAKDPRVVKEESDQIVAMLEEKGGDVEYLVLEDEGHGFSKKENEIKVYQRILDFLQKHHN